VISEGCKNLAASLFTRSVRCGREASNLITVSRRRASRRARQLSEHDARETFRRIGKDGDGFITVRELLADIRGYHCDDSLGSLDS
jgi:hypothetical protein